MHPYIIENEIPQIYLLNVSSSGIEVIITKSLYSNIFKKLKVTKELFSNIKHKEINKSVILTFPLPFITYPNFSHKALNWEVLNMSANGLAFFLQLMYQYIDFEEVARGEYYLNQEYPQLLSINVGFIGDGCLGPYIEAHFSQKAKMLLSNLQPSMNFGGILSKTYEQYLSLTESRNNEHKRQMKLFQKSGGRETFLSVTLNGPAPIFTVPGSCTSLGSDPEKFLENGMLLSHNMESSLQLITMILLLINFDHEILEPLYLRSIK